MEALISIFYILVFCLVIYRLRFFELEGLGRKGLIFIFLLKIGAGLVLWWIYTYYYTDRSAADIYKYFDDSKVMFSALPHHPGDFFRMLFGIGNNTPHFDQYYSQMHNWARQYESNLYNDSHTIIRYNALLRFFSFGYYQVHSIFICFLSLFGLTAIYKSFEHVLAGKRKLLVVAVFLVPSVLFWGSGVLKEGILLFGMGMLVLSWFRLCYGMFCIPALIWVLFCSLLLLVTKFYILVSLIPGLAYLLWMSKTKGHAFLKFAAVILLYGGLGLGVKYFVPAYDPLQVLAIKQQDFISLAKGGALLRTDTAIVFLDDGQRRSVLEEIGTSKTYRIKTGTRFCYWHDYNADADTLFGKQSDKPTVYTMEMDMPRSGSLINLKLLKPTLGSFFSNLPSAWFNTFFRPLPTEAHSLLLIPASAEIMVYSLFMLLCLFYRKKNPENSEYFWFCLSFVLLLFAITGLTTPVLGAIVRYKVPGIPFLLIAFLFLLDEEKLGRRLPSGIRRWISENGSVRRNKEAQ